MKNVVLLRKQDDGSIYCQQITKAGVDYVNSGEENDYWEEGGTILLDELEEILDREI